MHYNPWAKGVYDRIQGGQKTRKKKAAIALARKIAVLAWAMLRDGKDWDPAIMIRTTQFYGDTVANEAEVVAVKPKENCNQQKSRNAKVAREAAIAEATARPEKPQQKARDAKTTRKLKPAAKAEQPPYKPRRARKQVSAG